MTGPRDFGPWFADATMATDLPAWITPYRAYARLRGRDGHRALVASQRIARRLGLQRVGALTVDRTRVFVDLFDTRFPWVTDEIRSTSLQREVIARHLRPGDTFIDAGANHGSFSLLAARAVGKDGVVHAFEPNPFLARLITRSAEANCFTQLRVLVAIPSELVPLLCTAH